MKRRPPNPNRYLAWRDSHTDTSDPTKCWEWGAARDRDGYGRVGYEGRRSIHAHRVAYLVEHGSVPAGLHIDHLCRTRACVNPRHLEAVTQRENSLRSFSAAADNARKTHCDNGHEFDQANTRVAQGRRFCRACERRRALAYQARKRAAA